LEYLTCVFAYNVICLRENADFLFGMGVLDVAILAHGCGDIRSVCCKDVVFGRANGGHVNYIGSLSCVMVSDVGGYTAEFLLSSK
jgi:hypothetical protein